MKALSPLELKYYMFDWDDNILHMPTRIHLERRAGASWKPVSVTTAEFARIRRDTVNYRPRGGDWDSSFDISDQLSVTTSRDILAAIAEGKGPANALVALGYAGWTAGQLDQEILDNAWLTAKADPALIFGTPCEQRWSAAARLVGVDASQLPDYAGHA